MTERRSARARESKPSHQQSVTLVVTGVVALFALVFLFTGVDPLGLFTPDGPVTPDGTEDSAWWAVYFTDPVRLNDPQVLDGSVEEELIGYIDGARSSIHVAAFEFNLTPVAEALIAAHERGVEVRWVTDDEYGLFEDEAPDHGQFALLERADISVKADTRTALMHNKFWIFDRQIVWTGSTNVTSNGIFRNNNNAIAIRSRELAEIYEREFEEMWAGQFGPRSPSTVDEQALEIDGTTVRVYFAPEDEAISRILPLLALAKENIFFMAFSFTHDGMEEILAEQAQAGVAVQGIFETRGSETQYSAMRPLYCAGAIVRQDGNPGTFHHKVFIIDQKTVITGSLNFSDNADESNDENVLVIANTAIAKKYQDEFSRRWLEAEPPEAEAVKCR
jgi:phosphatidylserine/phosphatidylglycerophosphate/cardiolipin synthase-like enzyme